MSTVTGFAVDLAVANGACRRCSSEQALVWHDSPLCPLWGAAAERESAVTCLAVGCAKRTLRNDACCSDMHSARAHRHLRAVR